MVQWGLKAVSPSADVPWELTLKSWNDIVELKGIGSQMNPSAVSGEKAKSISWPETVMLVPAGDIWLSLFHVGDKVINVEFEGGETILLLNVLFENSSPLLAGNVVVNGLSGSRDIHLRVDNLLSNLHVALELLISLVESVVKRSSIKVDNTSASIHIVNGGGKSNLGSETVSSEGGHSDLFLVHKSYDIGRDVLKN